MAAKKLVAFQTLLRRLLDNSDLTLGEHEAVFSAFQKAARYLGTQPGEMHVVEVTEEAGKSGKVPAPRYDLAFHDTHPENSGTLITLTEANARDWVPHGRGPLKAKESEDVAEEKERRLSPLSSVFTP